MPDLFEKNIYFLTKLRKNAKIYEECYGFPETEFQDLFSEISEGKAREKAG